MTTVSLVIDGKAVQVPSGNSVLQAAEAGGIRIPVLCHHPALPPEGACRLCLVEIKGQRALQPACTMPASEGMVVDTHSERVMSARRFVLELLITDHPLDCMTCDAGGNCLLQDLAYEYHVTGERIPRGRQHQWSVDDPNPFIQVDRNKCILCHRCIRACKYINGVEAISVGFRGFDAKISFGLDGTMQESPCEFCGSCVEVCPTGALLPKMSLGKGRPWQCTEVQTTCSYCGVGCQLDLSVRDDQIVKVSGAQGAANHGFTCVKGRFGYDFVNHHERLTSPLVRRYLLEGKPKPAASQDGKAGDDFVPVSWDQALDLVTAKWAAIKADHGADALATLVSAKCSNEENYLAQKLFRQVVGTHNIDHCARL